MLNATIDIEVFRQSYWLKTELIAFCATHGLGTSGSKIELADKIACFLNKGTPRARSQELQASRQSSRIRDSDSPLSRTTPVLNYNNDAATRMFFVKEIGPRFRFNSFVRQFVLKENILPGMTYGDLVDGWLAEDLRKQINPKGHEIAKQFEYNRFIRDFFSHQSKDRPVATLKDAIKAWNQVKTQLGPHTYAAFVKHSQITP